MYRLCHQRVSKRLPKKRSEAIVDTRAGVPRPARRRFVVTRIAVADDHRAYVLPVQQVVQAQQLIQGLVRKGRVVGMDLVEIAPMFDAGNAITCITAGRLMLTLIGNMVRQGYLER